MTTFGPGNLSFKPAVAAASTADLGGTFALGATPASDTITGPAAVLTVDGYAAKLFDRILVKNQTAGSQNGIYVVTTAGSTTVGPIATVGSLVAGSGYTSGVYTDVPLLGGTGFGARGTVTISTGTISAFDNNTIVGAGYTNGTYTDVPLTGGSGTGATANIAVGSTGDISSVKIVNPGTGYVVGDVLSAATANLGGGTPTTIFGIKVATVTGGVSSVVVTSPGSDYPMFDSYPNNVGYTVGDVLSVPAPFIGGTGSGFSVTVATTTPVAWVLTRSVDSNSSNQFNGLSVWVGNGTTNGGKVFVNSAFPLSLDTGPIATLGTVVGGSGYVDGTYTNVPLFANLDTGALAAVAGTTGIGALATVVISGGAVTSVTVTNAGSGYAVGQLLSAQAGAVGGSGSGFSVPVATVTAGVPTFVALSSL